VVLASGEEIASQRVVLALGHSSPATPSACSTQRDVFVEAEAIRHRLPDRTSAVASSTAHVSDASPATRRIGAADYKLVHHAGNGRSVYSFCMCPGRHGGRRHLRARPAWSPTA
jgi:uncharacterized FAD-dependent dehydrogenase